jgi:hypothetical protein
MRMGVRLPWDSGNMAPVRSSIAGALGIGRMSKLKRIKRARRLHAKRQPQGPMAWRGDLLRLCILFPHLRNLRLGPGEQPRHYSRRSLSDNPSSKARMGGYFYIPIKPSTSANHAQDARR